MLKTANCREMPDNLRTSFCDGLNIEQRKAVLHREGPMLVTAGPGSGKTHVITTRLLQMIHVYQIPPEKIMVITFTKDAAKSMSSRFLKTYQQECAVSFGTFHSFYYQIIRSIPTYSQYRLIHEKEKKYILSQVISMPSEEEKDGFIEELLRAISFYKNTEDIRKAAVMADLQGAEFLKYMTRYDQEMNRRRVMDFDDMLYLCMKLLHEDARLLQKWQERFDYYLVDEFQDCNPVQYKILRMLASGASRSDYEIYGASGPDFVSESDRASYKCNLFMVGDDDQAIYGFRGAESLIMQKFIEDYPDAERVVLGINYRCAASIVKASSTVIKENILRIDKQLRANKQHMDDEHVDIKKWPGKTEMFDYFNELFKNLSNGELTDHALLFRTNQEMQMFAVELLKTNIPFQMKGKNISIYKHFLVKDIMAFLEVAGGNRERKLYLRILNKPRRHIGREALEEDTVDLEKVKAFYRNPYMQNFSAVQDVEKLQKHLSQLKRLPLALGIRYIRKAMDYEKYLHKRADGNKQLLDSWMELLDWLQGDSASFKCLKDWEEYQREYEIQGVQNCDMQDTGVHIMTMHASKGLEFEHCYILNVNDGMIPKYQKGQKLNQEQLEEERRIFYVGMTRAKKTLELHYLTGTKERPKFPSRFIQELLK